ncbi:MAG: nitroreductase family protein [Deltaproteobacteria bacterium]|nr:nitroreductase family protein [Deltaproteobacteria bacterium]
MRAIRRFALAAVPTLWVVAGALPARGDALDAMEALLKRTSLRVFDPARAVTDGELRQIMQAGWNAPTLDGSQPLEFVVIRNRGVLEELAGHTSYGKWLTKAPVGIAVLVRTAESPQLFRENGAMAVMRMYYKAQELGLGITFQGTANRESMKRSLGVGKNRHLLTVIPVGAPPAGLALKSPPRAPLALTVFQDQLGKAATLFEGTTALARAGRPMRELLDREVDVLSFDGRAVEPDVLRSVFEAMRAAPSSKNRQPWRWVLVRDPETKARIARAAKDRVLAEAPVVAVLAGSYGPPPADFGTQLKKDPHNTVTKRKLVHFFMPHDLGCALANLRLGAESLGLGVRIAPVGTRGENKVRAALSQGGRDSRHGTMILAAVGLGYAQRTTIRPRSELPEQRISYETHGVRGQR